MPTLPDIFYYFKCILSLSKYSLDIEKSIKYIRDFVISLFPITIFWGFRSLCIYPFSCKTYNLSISCIPISNTVSNEKYSLVFSIIKIYNTLITIKLWFL